MQRKSSIYKTAGLYKKNSMAGWHAVRDRKCSTLFHFVGLLALVFLCISCAASSVEPPAQSKVLTGYDEAEQEKATEANDMACSYFYFPHNTITRYA